MSTLLVLLQLKNSFLIAADGKRKDELGNSFRACKIIRNATFTFAASGLTESRVHSVWDMARSLGRLPSHIPIAHRVKQFEESALIALAEVVRSFRQKQKQIGPQIIDILADGSLLTAIFVACEGGVVRRYARRFSLVVRTEVAITQATVLPSFDGTPGPFLQAFGSGAAAVGPFMQKIVQQPPPSPVELMSRILEEGERLAPDKVGKPYSMIHVTEHSSDCVPDFTPPQGC